MELRDYVRILSRRWWILVLVPLLAGGAVAVSTLSQPDRFTATATVAAPALVGGTNANQYSGANGPQAFVANFGAAVTSPVIVNLVSDETKVARKKLKDGLVATQIGTSSLIEVTYTTTAEATAGPVAVAAARRTILFLFESQVALAQEPVTAARQAVEKAQADLDAFVRTTGQVVPDRFYEVKATQIANLEGQRDQAAANGDTFIAARLNASIGLRQADLAGLAPLVATHDDLTDKKAQATTNLNQVQQSLQQARAQLEAANPAKVVNLATTESVSVAADLARKGLTALAAALFLAVGLIALLEVTTVPTPAPARSRKETTKARGAAPQPRPG